LTQLLEAEYKTHQPAWHNCSPIFN